jgi:lipid A ethanolaminephosphotransferase
MLRTLLLQRHSLRLGRVPILLITAAVLTLGYNLAYYRRVLELYPPVLENLGFLASIVLLQFALTLLLITPFSFRYTLKPVLMVLLIAAASAAYFMDKLGVVIDRDMLRNILQTDMTEAGDLVSPGLLGYLLVLGVLPCLLLWWVEFPRRGWRRELWENLRLFGLALVGLALLLVVSYKPYASFFREHKPVRYYSNPMFMVYSVLRYGADSLNAGPQVLSAIGLDAHIPPQDEERELIIMVVGETARADHFSLNGYARETNPMLAREALFNFTQVTSCATSTALSVPCMFSLLTQEGFSTEASESSENVLDVLRHAGINVLWRDNNSSSKGVADRVQYEDFRSPENNPECDTECRDIGMLAGLQDYVDAQAKGDILIVLHQMGNHGPAYFKRYPGEFERFKPACQSAELSECNEQEIINAYDNAIVYTDYFLARVIGFLKGNNDRFETALIYASDHGESLGENGIYLHGLPNLFAPGAQRHVPAFLWLGDSYHDVDREKLRAKLGYPLSHDHLFHTLLGLFEVESSVHQPSLDLLSDSW